MGKTFTNNPNATYINNYGDNNSTYITNIFVLGDYKANGEYDVQDAASGYFVEKTSTVSFAKFFWQKIANIGTKILSQQVYLDALFKLTQVLSALILNNSPPIN